ncbi:MAG: polyribonucleotide nucleotidyltransferase [Planctomycetota bacterium]
MKHRVEREISGRTLSIETGEIAKQTAGAVLVQYGGTVVFAAVTHAEPMMAGDFFPLTVDYREKTYAAGKFPGGFFKREGRPTTKETLTGRVIDRPMRPLFPEGFFKEVSVSAMALSADKQNDPDILAMIAASAAVSISGLPFNGPVGAVRMGLKGEFLLVNPTHAERDESTLDLVIAGTEHAVTMVEAGAQEVAEEVILDAIDEGHRVIRVITSMIRELCELVDVKPVSFTPPEVDDSLKNRLAELAARRYRDVLLTPGKAAKKAALDVVTKSVIAEVCPEGGDPETTPDPKQVKAMLSELRGKVERRMIAEEGIRADGRGLTDIRPISTRFSLLPCTHGSALFTRGETQALVVVTLGTGFDEQRVDGLLDETKDKFMLHYNFPSFSVGETWPNRGPKRREIGHGYLAERAIRSIMPPADEFPYTVRIVSEVMESNGSSSMATVCGGTLALMDAGVKIRRPVAGIAMGLVKEGEKICVLSDILGSEDHDGDMDFKVAGTQRGITALQMDIKVEGIDRDVMSRALEQAKEGRIHILREMLQELKRPREEISPLAPKIIRIKINPEKIGMVIGPGGKMIKGIQEETGATIEIQDDGTVTIWGSNDESASGARTKIELITEEVQVGQIYEGRVVSIRDFGCFVEVLPGQEGLVHVSELHDSFVEDVSAFVKAGDRMQVKVIGIDGQGRIRLSRKALLIIEGGDGPDGEESGQGVGGGDRDRGDGPRGDRPPRGGDREGPRGGGRDRGGRGGGGGRR